MEGFVWCQHCGAPHAIDSKFCPRTGKSLSTRNSDRQREEIGAGTVIDGRYRIVGLIGRGGQSVVYEATHLKLGQNVALKFMASPPNEKTLGRFEQEARLAATIAHPNVCRSYDFGVLASGTRYIVMERLNGLSLASLIAHSTSLLEVPFVVHIVTQVLSGLMAAHAAGVVHRDIKPGNIFVETAAGVAPIAKLLDFGFAKLSEKGKSVRTTLGKRVGTPAYMSPEQINGRELDARSDLFSVGVVLYEMLLRKRPFAGASDAELMASILRDMPAEVVTVRLDVPRALSKIVRRALEKQPDVRYGTAEELRKALLALNLPTGRAPAIDRGPDSSPIPVLHSGESSSS
jgi:serine/threonine-protein kinase